MRFKLQKKMWKKWAAERKKGRKDLPIFIDFFNHVIKHVKPTQQLYKDEQKNHL